MLLEVNPWLYLQFPAVDSTGTAALKNWAQCRIQTFIVKYLTDIF